MTALFQIDAAASPTYGHRVFAKKLLIAAVVLAISGTGLWVYFFHVHVSRESPAGPSSAGDKIELSRTHTPPAAQPEPLGIRAQIRQTGEEKARVITTEPQLDAYLEELESRARAKRKVTALEVEPGIDMIRMLGPTLGSERSTEKLRAFTKKMTRLSADLDGRGAVPAVDFDALGRDIARAPTESRRQELIKQYMESVHGLDPGNAAQQIERLNRIAAETRPR